MTTSGPTDDSKRPRRPAAFAIDDGPGPKAPSPPAPAAAGKPRQPQSFEDSAVVLTPETEDPFLTPGDATLADVPVASPRPRRFSFAGLAAGAFGVLLSLALGLWTDRLIRDLFNRADWLGYLAIAAAAIGLLALAAAVLRELVGMARLHAVQALKEEAEKAAAETKPAAARAVVAKLTALLASKAETARGRATLAATEGEIIDGSHLLALAEREMLAPLDRQARALILGAAKRVSVITAVSPRAIVDLAYVIYESARLVRSMADLYGGRPGTLGMVRLMRDVVAHLAVTGSIAIGDGIVQQVLGHGLASKLSARLGEGVINGLMTARIGIAAMDLCRPLPFKATKRPGIGDFMGDLTPKFTGGDAGR
ncbi:TIGR01620 family protein [Rhizobiaceae bacterium n13]|uniref:UPF0283 membrane protein MRS75_19580 n=1 Tax=Ferirhizobium litorale TaxID=2927786 RepID=A0AAE3U5A0_9HYPH|nr:TIGR01620 family protein [Fererhizobium litorale]MDI7863900.1 TIGR01620 family protein [Fererhizobium litorale]MDI7924268.1 TIGR01620 family protein [Fererhizobium litorale]